MSSKMQQKDLIIALREEGLSYKEISERTGATSEYARSVYSRAMRKRNHQFSVSDGICRFCGERLIYTKGAKKKQFCNDECRTNFYNQQNQHKLYIRTCEYCGQEFVAYGYPKKRFCSRECQTLARRGKKSA